VYRLNPHASTIKIMHTAQIRSESWMVFMVRWF
jgi:hypothetical protein